MAIKSKFPTTRPSLLLDFANTANYDGTANLDPRVTFVRNSTKTTTDRRGFVRVIPAGVAAAPFDATSGACRGLLVEGQRTNVLTFSEHFTNAAWQKTNVIVLANVARAPDGTITASKLVEDTTNGFHYILQGGTAPAGSTVTNSVYAKAAERSWVYVQSHDGVGFPRAFFNLATGTIGTQANGATATITNEGDGWYRCAITYVMQSGTDTNCYVFPATGNGVTSYTGNGVSGVFIWGADLGEGSPNGYIPSAVTFTGRPGSGTCVGPNGLITTAESGVARLEYNQSDLTIAPKLLLEEQRTNVILNSDTYADYATVSTGTAVAPDGSTAYKVVPNAGAVAYPGRGNVALQTISISTTQGQVTDVTFSGYFSGFGPKNYKPYIVITAATGASQQNPLYALLMFDATAGTFGVKTLSTGWTELQAPTAMRTITGMWLVTWTVRYTQQAVLRDRISHYFQIYNELNQNTYTADGASGVQYACMQLEQGSYRTSYIPTTTAQVTRVADTSTSAQTTRAADIASMTGGNFSSWYNPVEGTFVCEFNSRMSNSESVFGRIWSANAGTNADEICLLNNVGWTPDRLAASVLFSLTAQFDATDVAGGYVTSPISAVNATAYKANDFSTVFNSANVVTDTSGAIPRVTRFDLGSFNGGSTVSCVYIGRLMYYQQRLPSSNQQALTA